MIVLCRFRVPDGEVDAFVDQATAALDVLTAAAGCLSVDLGRNLDDPSLFGLVTRWRDVGSYRRALGSYEAKIAVVPLLSRAVDEPTAYDDIDQVGPNLARGSDLAGLS